MVKLDTFGKRLKAARERAGLTQDELATRLDKHRFTVAKWEQELHPPKKPADYDDMAYQLNCSVLWLREGVGEMGSVYVPDPEAPDVVSRRAVRRMPRQRVSGVSEGPGGAYRDDAQVDWPLVAHCAGMLLQVAPALSLKALARALPLCYALAQRAPGSCDAAMARQILQALDQ